MHLKQWFKSRSNALLGMDISAHAVKVLALGQGTHHPYSVQSYGVARLPAHAIRGNVVRDVDAVSSVIRDLVQTMPTSTKKVALAVPDSAVITKTLQFNEGLMDHELEDLIWIEVEKHIPYPMHEINVDFQVLGPSEKNVAQVDVLLVASRKEYVDSRIEAITRAGLIPYAVDVESFVVERAMEHWLQTLPEVKPNQRTAILDLGATYTNLFVWDGQRVIFSHEEAFGGEQLVALCVEQTQQSREEVFQALEVGTLFEDESVHVALQQFQQTLLMQSKRLLQLFYSSGPYSSVDRLILAGGLVHLPGLQEQLHATFDVPCTLADIFSDMDIEPTLDAECLYQAAPTLLMAYGLALREAKG